MATDIKAQGVLLVGSVNLPTTTDVFERVSALLPNRLRRIPDGETGDREFFVKWQLDLFSSAPEVLLPLPPPGQPFQPPPPPPPPSAAEHAATLAKLPTLHTQYDDAALESYKEFRRLKSDGVIPTKTRFQVSLPGVANVLFLIQPAYQEAIETRYADALVRSLQRIQNEIPHDQLAIQIDVAAEFALLEKVPTFRSYFEPTIPIVVEKLASFAKFVSPDVELGFHLCYGDQNHAHFIQPKDTGLMVEVANALMTAVKRPVAWIHLPVPKERNDEGYFLPLKNLKGDQGMELYLGLVHFGDLEGTKEKIRVVRRVLGSEGGFGVATECGLGRTPREEFEGIMEILGEVSGVVV